MPSPAGTGTTSGRSSSPTPSSTSTPAPASPSPRGPDALVEFIERALAPFTFFEFTILNATVDVDGDEATGRVYICELRHDGDGAWSEAYGLYRDRYRRRDGAWRIAGAPLLLARPQRAPASAPSAFPLPT